MILVLDLGSSSTRAGLYAHASAAPVAIARRTFDFSVDERGRSEDDPRAALARVIDVMDELAPAAARLPRIEWIGVSSYATSLLVLDATGQPLTPAYTYADTRAAADARRMRQAFDELETLQRTGCRLRANYWPARIAWLQRTQPELSARMRRLVSLPDYLTHALCGELRSGVSIAAWTGMLNRATRDWDRAWLERLGLRAEQLAPVWTQQAQPLTLSPPWAARWPWLKHAQFAPPLGDGAAANIGSGCVDASQVAVTIGTTAAMRVVADATSASQAQLPQALWQYFVDHAHALIGGATTEGGNVFAWARRTLQLPPEAELERALADMQPNAHGLTVLPTFAGERSPGYAEDIRATLHGLSLSSSGVDIVRACMEAIAIRLAQLNAALRESGLARQDARLVASGGALETSPAWCQMVADACGSALVLADTSEATSRGVAMVAAWQSGQAMAGDTPAPTAGRVFEPRPAHTQAYRAAGERLAALYAALLPAEPI